MGRRDGAAVGGSDGPGVGAGVGRCVTVGLGEGWGVMVGAGVGAGVGLMSVSILKISAAQQERGGPENNSVRLPVPVHAARRGPAQANNQGQRRIRKKQARALCVCEQRSLTRVLCAGEHV